MSAKLTLGGIRLVVGLLTWILPNISAKVFGLKKPDDVQILAWRLFASRETALALLTLTTTSPETTTLILQTGILIDLADAFATLITYSRSSISSYAGVAVGIGALFFAGLGYLAL
mmetsp:Transcript_9544/g.10056  ORF Transcript_9544/g.10056 Transcript_9544/m.10056 type:complete len:116 (-) Transcript_9544:3-350(-)